MKLYSSHRASNPHLTALYPEPNLFGRDAREQAVVEMWNAS